MTDTPRRRAPTPHLQTRPATMITAIGLCLLIMLMQLVPQVQNRHTPPATTTVADIR
ncbi:hypothetical protein [Enhydrobacter sp.]|jgi:hypothetical protein|uniref:hypothetical protein n=1 Tax=Enhydrobacter sp. TaxID=1894999 RepID=UPI00262601C5|nr:hypothetical protein [Enhydrobacter sp.]WIM11293.1 MAG: hypothetical protein OJF58_002250 [Enhydrobacter sp.]